MKIAMFDIDDTITYETDFLEENAPDFLKKKYGLNVDVVDKSGYRLDVKYGLTEKLMNTGMPMQKAHEHAKAITDSFWSKNFVKYNLTPLRSGAKEVIDELIDRDYEIYFVSLRGKKSVKNNSIVKDRIRLCIILSITKLMLHRNKVRYHKILLVQSEEEKVEVINCYNPAILFEDQMSILNQAGKKIQKVCISNPHNETCDLPENTIRLSDFNSFQIDLENANKSLVRNKVFHVTATDIFQKMCVCILRHYFIWRYRPIVYGKQYLSKSEGVAFVGNHRNKLDPVFISITSGRPIHWAALLRLFQGKEDLFSAKSNVLRRKLSSIFLKAIGALPIARDTDENYEAINRKTIGKLTEFLEMRKAIGFFPEGTINRKPDEVNILPLKSNRVFRMAMETEGFIQPFSIVWIEQSLGIRNRVVVVYSPPINTSGRNKLEVKQMWQKSVDENIDKSSELIRRLHKAEKKDRKNIIENYKFTTT